MQPGTSCFADNDVGQPLLQPLAPGDSSQGACASADDLEAGSSAAQQNQIEPTPGRGIQLWPAAIVILSGLAVKYALSPPDGVTDQAWSLSAIFLSTILALILEPLPAGACALLAAGVCMVSGTLTFQQTFAAMANSEVIWLVVLALFFAKGFQITGLGERVAHTFVRILGGSPLGLSLGLVLAEAAIAPAMPSTAARAGGIFMPVIKSLAEAAGSYPQDDASRRRLGAFLTHSQFQAGVHSSSLFLTAAAQNLLCLDLAKQQGINIPNPFFTWLYGATLPALAGLLLTPLLVHRLLPPSSDKHDTHSHTLQLEPEACAHQRRETGQEVHQPQQDLHQHGCRSPPQQRGRVLPTDQDCTGSEASLATGGTAAAVGTANATAGHGVRASNGGPCTAAAVGTRTATAGDGARASNAGPCSHGLGAGATAGPLSRDEKLMGAAVVLCMVLWVAGPAVGVSAVSAILVGLGLLLCTGVLTWQDCLSYHPAWDTLVWFSILLGMSAQLNSLGVIDALANAIAAHLLPGGGANGGGGGKASSPAEPTAPDAWLPSFGVLHLLFFVVHFLFASQTAHVAALYPAFCALMVKAGAPPQLSALTLAYNVNLFGSLTHYASGQAAVFTASGYMHIAEVFVVGALNGALALAIWAGLGMPLWKLLGWW